MSVHMRKHHISSENSVIHFIYDNVEYAIPKNIASRYTIIPEKTREKTIPAGKVFAPLIRKYTRAGALLKGLRARENMTQAEFAEALELTQANLSKMENGKRAIGKTIAKRIETKYKVNYRNFLE